jgi:hypothetical protein
VLAARNVSEIESRGKQIVARQREIVAGIAGPVVPSATELLNDESSLTLFEEDLLSTMM